MSNVDRNGVQHRSADLIGAAVTETDSSLEFRGAHAAVFDQQTYIGVPGGRGFVERLAPTAFDNALKDPGLDCRMLQNHDKTLVLARTTNGTLRLSTDQIGLVPDADMAPTSYARDLVILLNRGDVSQMSFAFSPSRDGEEWDEVEMRSPQGRAVVVPRVTVRSVAGLHDVSPVTFPAYPGTDVGVRLRDASDEARIAVDILTHSGPTSGQLRELELFELFVRGGFRTL